MSSLLPLLTWRSAICDSDLESTTRLVAWGLSHYMSERGDSAHPGPSRLAHDTGLHLATVKAHLAVLLERGWIVIVEKGGIRGEKRRANVYAARVPDYPQPVVHGTGSDPSSTTTGSPDRDDPSSSPRAPVVQGDPISPLISPENTRARATRGPRGAEPPDPTDATREAFYARVDRDAELIAEADSTEGVDPRMHLRQARTRLRGGAPIEETAAL